MELHDIACQLRNVIVCLCTVIRNLAHNAQHQDLDGSDLPTNNEEPYSKIQAYVFKKAFDKLPENARDAYKMALGSKDICSSMQTTSGYSMIVISLSHGLNTHYTFKRETRNARTDADIVVHVHTCTQTRICLSGQAENEHDG